MPELSVTVEASPPELVRVMVTPGSATPEGPAVVHWPTVPVTLKIGHGVGVGEGATVAVAVAVGDGVGVGVGIEHGKATIEIVSMCHPGALVAKEEPMRKRSLIVCPATFGPRFATVSM